MPDTRAKRKALKVQWQQVGKSAGDRAPKKSGIHSVTFHKRQERHSLEHGVHATNPRDGLVVISDNLEPPSVEYLKRHGVQVVSVQKTKSPGVSDKKIYKVAALAGAVVVTHDRDFEVLHRPSHSKLIVKPYQRPGVAILPMNRNGPSSPERYAPLKAALAHLVKDMPHTNREWGDRIVRYTRGGQINDPSLPLKPGQAPLMQPNPHYRQPA